MTPTQRKAPPRGFTMLEVMIVVAIIAIITGLAITGLQQMTARTAAQNLSHDFYSAMSVARARAAQTGKDVWFIVYPAGGPSGKERGAFYLFEDRDGQFRNASSTYNFANHFRPDNLVPPTTTEGRLYLSGLLHDYSPTNVAFGFNDKFDFGEPFTALNSTITSQVVGCSFCEPSAPFGPSSRGAIVFSGDGSARFVGDDGAMLDPHPPAVSLAITSRDQIKATLYAVSAATGFIAQFNR